MFDGHSGIKCAEYLKAKLFKYVGNSLENCAFENEKEVRALIPGTVLMNCLWDYGSCCAIGSF